MATGASLPQGISWAVGLFLGMKLNELERSSSLAPIDSNAESALMSLDWLNKLALLRLSARGWWSSIWDWSGWRASCTVVATVSLREDKSSISSASLKSDWDVIEMISLSSSR